MRRFDVFNGDADGICALRQLRLAHPAEAELVTGLKRDIALLARVPAESGDEVTVLDVSLDRNRVGLEHLLARGAEVRWFDHHEPFGIPRHPRLAATIDTAAGMCTSELVDQYLGGAWRAWAVVGAFGDNLEGSAARLALGAGLPQETLARLRDLGESLNYNAYGASEADVIVPPAELYRLAARHHEPLAFHEREPLLARIAAAREADLDAARGVAPERSTGDVEIHRLPATPWSRRVLGSFANLRAREDAARAHLVLAPVAGGAFMASLRTPAGALPAARFARAFGDGGGRATAAGVDRIEPDALGAFIHAFERAYGRTRA